MLLCFFDNGILSLKSVGMAEKEGKKGELTKIWGNDSTACIFEWVKVVKKLSVRRSLDDRLLVLVG